MGYWGNMMGRWGNGYGYGGYGMGRGLGIMGFLMPLLYGVVIILLVTFLFRRLRRGNRSDFIDSRQNRSLEILRERFARGEIDSAEYQSRKQDLENS